MDFNKIIIATVVMTATAILAKKLSKYVKEVFSMPDNDMNKSIETNNSGLNNAESSSPQGMAKTDQSSKPEQKAEKSTAGNTQNLPGRVNSKASLADSEIQEMKSDFVNNT